mgnify:CR=1 FL=1
MRDLEIIRSKHGFISDMDGVIYQGSQLLPGVKEFVDWLRKEKKQFLFLTNSSERTPLELHKKLLAMGIDIDESHFYTSANSSIPKDTGTRFQRLYHRCPRTHERALRCRDPL